MKLLSEVLGLAFAVLGSIASKKRALLLKNGRDVVGSMMVVLRCAPRHSRCVMGMPLFVCMHALILVPAQIAAEWRKMGCV